MYVRASVHHPAKTQNHEMRQDPDKFLPKTYHGFYNQTDKSDMVVYFGKDASQSMTVSKPAPRH